MVQEKCIKDPLQALADNVKLLEDLMNRWTFLNREIRYVCKL